MTAIYSARQITLVFLGKPRTQSAEHAGENKPVMTFPLIVLAFFAITAGWIGIPHSFPLIGKFSTGWLQGFLGSMLHFEAEAEAHSSIPLFTSLAVSLGGLLIGWLLYRGYKDIANRLTRCSAGLGPVFTLLEKQVLD